MKTLKFCSALALICQPVAVYANDNCSDPKWFPGSSSVLENEIFAEGFIGKWAPSLAECSTDQDGVESMFIYQNGIDFYESGGRLQRITQAGSDRTVAAKIAFEGEGGFWDVVWEMELSSNYNTLTISELGNEGNATYFKCAN